MITIISGKRRFLHNTISDYHSRFLASKISYRIGGWKRMRSKGRVISIEPCSSLYSALVSYLLDAVIATANKS